MVTPSNKQDEAVSTPPQFLVVGLGASAGGVEALQTFFAHVSADSGVAYVVILHLSPAYDSHLAEVLQTVSDIPVTQVRERVRVEPNHIYVMPPDQHLVMLDGHLDVVRNTSFEERRAPVDIFFRALAESHGARAVCVVLSGTGANGSMGLKRVKEHGGAVFVQPPREAEFGEMPRNALATGLVDAVVPVAEIPQQILDYQAHLGSVQIFVDTEDRSQSQQQALREVFAQLRLRTGHDFSTYKRPTLLRRIERRINVHKLPDLPAYVAFLHENSDEAQALLKDVLISVTNFFRDQAAFAALEYDILPRIFAGKHAENQVRLWVVGCATGEEAYSLAMLCAERTFDVIDAPKVQVFATDIDEAAIAHAREGLYTLNDAADVSPERLRRFFTKEGERYRVRRELRELVLFANHNILKDPPFSHLDLVSCRNVLIYLNHAGQERVMETFHFALNPGAYLFLGSSESTDGASDLYASVSREHHIFQSRHTGARPYPLPEGVPNFRIAQPQGVQALPSHQDERRTERMSYGELHQQLLEQYAPPSLVVNEEYEIVHLSEQAGRYLQLSGGEPSKNLLKLLRPELQLEVRAALYRAVQQQTNVEVRNLAVRLDERTESVHVLVRPVLRQDDTARGFLLVVFEQHTETGGTVEAEVVLPSSEPLSRQLEAEVMRLHAQLRGSNEQHEFQTEELKAANEELQAMNEELRSAAEELETSKEELQSINEELYTVNQELKVKIEEATQTSANLQNLVNSTDIGTIFLDRSFQIRLFTPAAQKLFNLIALDYGRPLSDITSRLVRVNILADAEAVLANLQPIEREVTTTDGRVFLMRVLPYRIEEDRIGGVVLTFLDITERKRAEEVLRTSEERQAFLLKLSDALRPLSDPVKMQATASRVLGEHLQTDRAYYVEIDQANNVFVVARDWHRPGSPSHARRYPLNDWPMPWLMDGNTWVVRDVDTDPAMPDDQRTSYRGNNIGAAVVVPLIKAGRLVATFLTNQRAPRAWAPHEIALVEETAERLWAAVERAHVEAALRESEARHRTLFDAVDEGVCVFERLPLRPDGLRDYRYIDMNPAMQAIFGIPDLSGQSIRDSFPDEAEAWYDTYDRVLETGQPTRFERASDPQGLALEMFVTRLEDGSGQRLLAVMQDVTERKRREANLAFLAEVSQDLAGLTTISETMNALGARIGGHFNASRCAFFEFNETMDGPVCEYDWHLADVPDLVGSYRTADFYTDEFLQTLRAREAFVLKDRDVDSRVDAKSLAAFNIASLIVMPIVTDKQSLFILCINDTVPRDWRDDEIELMRELTTRIWTRLERARVEEELAASEEKYRTLFDSIDEGFALEELVYDDAGNITDIIFHEVNKAYERQSGYTDVVGKSMSQLIPDLEQHWKDIFTQVAKTGEPVRYTNYAQDTGRWFDTYITMLAGSDKYVVVVFNDITNRKRAEAALYESEARYRLFVTAVSDILYKMSADWSEMHSLEGKGFLADTESPSLSWLESYIPDSDKPLAQATIDEAIRAKKTFELEHRVVRADGTVGWTFSRAVPLLDERGEIVEWFGAASDITERKRAGEQQAYLLMLSDTLRPLEDATAIEREATRMLGEALGTNRVFFASIETDGDTGVILSDYVNGIPSGADRYSISAFAARFVTEWRAGRTTVTPDVTTDPRFTNAERVAYASVSSQAEIGVPLVKGGRLVALLGVSHATARAWTAAEIALTQETAERLGAAVERARAEAALREADERFRTMTDTAPVLIWETDASGLMFVNQRYLDFFGESLDALRRMGWTQFLHPDDAAGYIAVYQAAFVRREPYTYECRFRHADGSYRWLLNTGQPLNAHHFVGTSADITERKQAEADLRASEARFRTLTDAVPQVIWANDGAGTANYFNERWFTYSGLSLEQSFGLGWQAIVHPDDAPASVERWQRALAAGNVFDTEYRLRGVDGGYRWHLGRNVPLHDHTGRVIGWFGSATDIHDLKVAEAAVRASAERLQIAIAAAEMATWDWDVVTGEIRWNEQHFRMFGMQPTDAPQTADVFFAHIYPDDRDAVVARLEAAVRDNRVFTAEFRVVRDDGAIRWMSGYGQSVNVVQGAVVFMSGVMLDITERKQVEQALQDAHDALEVRVAERTTELASSNSLLQVEVAERRQLEAQRTMLLERIITAQESERKRVAHELHDTLGQLLSALTLRLSMAQSREGMLPTVRHELAQLQELTVQVDQEVDRITMELRPPALEHLGLADALGSYVEEWTATSGVPVDMLAMGLDNIRLAPPIETTTYRIVQEALTNVLKHAQATSVSVIVERQARELRVIVEDNGMGFERTQDPGDVARGQQVGLVGMFERAALAGGDLTIESAPGAGTTIYLHIPLSDDALKTTGGVGE